MEIAEKIVVRNWTEQGISIFLKLADKYFSMLEHR